MAESRGPLEGIRVLELGSSVAGPFCGRLFADFGAEVIKVEVAEGDAVRSMGKRVEGKSLYAASIFRNKRLISVDTRTEEGRSLVRRLAEKSDVLVENFRPGTLERLGLGYETLSAVNPGLVMVRISGFGQTGPYADRAGYGAIGEALSGLRHLTGDPDRAPARIAASVTDEITGIYGCMGAMMALWSRQASGKGQVVDATLFESAFSLIEPHVLDLQTGQPSPGVRVDLEKRSSSGWQAIGSAVTDEQGRIRALVPQAQLSNWAAGDYRVVFRTGEFYQQQKQATFFPEIPVVFHVDSASQHYHVPLLLSPYGFSTYRGN